MGRTGCADLVGLVNHQAHLGRGLGLFGEVVVKRVAAQAEAQRDLFRAAQIAAKQMHLLARCHLGNGRPGAAGIGSIGAARQFDHDDPFGGHIDRVGQHHRLALLQFRKGVTLDQPGHGAARQAVHPLGRAIQRASLGHKNRQHAAGLLDQLDIGGNHGGNEGSGHGRPFTWWGFA